ncbi:hypothetical protein E1B28_003360 [Marasmius oreades]|uniref:Uncharacterized protein n=1 Tax=Marasmius oreades TaxID=181124 RepID=A0A9P7RM21_9AGAR|nr:uncharacterized protein E1B28_003360 [Marasmius oreades]KAG7085822.1 hypothetical protein E1B28_003360 [Marasmius oreades]
MNPPRRSKSLYCSLVKKSKLKANTYVHIPGQSERKRKLAERLETLLKHAASLVDKTAIEAVLKDHEDDTATMQDTGMSEMNVEDPSDALHMPVDVMISCGEAVVDDLRVDDSSIDDIPADSLSKIAPGTQPEGKKLDTRWKEMLPSLLEPFLTYRDQTIGSIGYHFGGFKPLCSSSTCRTD